MSTTDFASLSLSPALLAVLEELSYTEATPIQVQGIPVLLAGKDLIGQSKTGSGKTAAFALPILQRLEIAQRRVQALIICPTRELCGQVVREARKLGRRHDGLRIVMLTGGSPFSEQAAALERGAHIAVGTPGRLLDHQRRGTLDTRSMTTVVLDEADRMLDMGFLPDVEQILSALPTKRQTALFSATFPAAIKAISKTHQTMAVEVAIADTQEPLDIRQRAFQISSDTRLHGLHWVLANNEHNAALIFCNFKASVAEVVSALAAAGASVDGLHGDLDQFERDQVLARLRNRSLRILVATDVAGRGLDVEDLDLVINYEMSPQAETYVHRVGRTGRAGKGGVAVSLHTARDLTRLKEAEAATGIAIERLDSEKRLSASPMTMAQAFARPAPMDSILISGGRKDKVRPGDILGALTGEAGGLQGSDIGKIEIHDRLAYVAVSRRVSKSATASLNKGRIKGRRFRATLVRPRMGAKPR